MNKQDAIQLLSSTERVPTLTLKNTHWANLSTYGRNKGWWLNIPFEKFDQNLYIILNDEENKNFIFLSIGKQEILYPRQIFRDKNDTADIFINKNESNLSLCDIQSNSDHFDFKPYKNGTYIYDTEKSESDFSFPEEVPFLLKEGSKKSITVNAYERNTDARKKCIEKYGVLCAVCGFNFEKIYGSRGKGFIHVHHLIPLSQIGSEYQIDPIKDLRPVCPNCHSMLHRFENISIQELINEINLTKFKVGRHYVPPLKSKL